MRAQRYRRAAAGSEPRARLDGPRIPPGHYFFLGDNRADSCDSRTWGTVPRSSLIGPVILTYWPPNRIAWH